MEGKLRKLEPYKSKTQLAYESIKENILSGALAPGTRLIVSKLANQLSFSSIPVREALQRLEAEGLIVSKPNAGALVSEISLREMAEVIAVRRVLEGLAGQEAAKRIDKVGLKRLSEILNGMHKCVQRGEHCEFGLLNKKFHAEIYRASGNELLADILGELWAKTERSRAVFLLVPQRCTEALAEHEDILQALKSRDSQRTKQLMKEHRSRAGAELIRCLQKNVAIM